MATVEASEFKPVNVEDQETKEKCSIPLMVCNNTVEPNELKEITTLFMSNEKLKVVDAHIEESKCCHAFNSIIGYVYGLIFALLMCLANVFVKMAPSLNGSNH